MEFGLVKMNLSTSAHIKIDNNAKKHAKNVEEVITEEMKISALVFGEKHQTINLCSIKINARNEEIERDQDYLEEANKNLEFGNKMLVRKLETIT